MSDKSTVGGGAAVAATSSSSSSSSSSSRSKNVRLKSPPTPEVRKQTEVFSRNLAQWMQKKSLSQSDLASRVWGRTKDGRGYEVARNRDRISAYLAGAGMPEPGNLKELAKALGCKIEDLVGPDGIPPPATRRVATYVEVHLAMVQGQPGKMQVQMNMILPSALALEIVGMADKYRRQTEGTNGEGGSDDQ